MAKNILILLGSPRKNANTKQMAREFAQGAQENGHQVTIIDAAALDVHGCMACDQCWKLGIPCVQEDDFYKITPALEKADVLVFACPVYFYGMPAQLKAVIDRLYSYCSEETLVKLNIKESVLLMAAADDEPKNFDGAVATYKTTAEFLGWEDRGALVADHVSAQGEIVNGDWLQRCYELGRSL